MNSPAQQLLTQQLNQLHSLEALLVTEKEILQQHQPDKLIEIAEQKNNILLCIQDLDSKIAQVQSFVQEKAQGLYSEELKEITESLERCKKSNMINGKVIQQSQIAVEKMKTSLLVSQNKASVTYDSKGKTSGSLNSLGLKA